MGMKRNSYDLELIRPEGLEGNYASPRLILIAVILLMFFSWICVLICSAMSLALTSEGHNVQTYTLAGVVSVGWSAFAQISMRPFLQ